MSIINAVASVAIYLYLRFAYAPISHTHRHFFDYSLPAGTYLPRVRYYVELVSMLKTMRWKRDGVSSLWDAFCTPEEVYRKYLSDRNAFIGDCDEFAVFISNVLNGSWEVFQEPLFVAQILTVTYRRPDGSFGGHNVALLQRPCRKRVWDTPTTQALRVREFGYMDYDMPQWYASIEWVVAAITDRYGGAGAEALAYCVRDAKTLKPLSVKIVK